MINKIISGCILFLLTNTFFFTQVTTINQQALELLNNQNPGDTIRFAVLSDMHYGWYDVAKPRSFFNLSIVFIVKNSTK